MKPETEPMRILAVDTSSMTCSVAVLADGAVADISYTSSRTHSHHLMGMIDQSLRLAGVRADRLTAVAVTRGPGTFTGLRIGISAAKGIALAAGKPLLGLSGLEALAVQTAEPKRMICPMVDARRAEVYAACYRPQGGTLRRVSEERAWAPVKMLETIREPCLFVGSGAEQCRDLIAHTLGPDAAVAPAVQNALRASTLARMAAERLKTGAGGDAAQLVPVYLRRSDAELKLGKKRVAPTVGS